MRLRVGLSTCPNDTFLFHGLLSGRVTVLGLELELRWFVDVDPASPLAGARRDDFVQIELQSFF